MDQINLNAQERKVLGKKVKNLRKEGKIPAHIFGHRIKTIHVSVDQDEFLKVNQKAGETGVVSLKIGGDLRPTLIRAVQKHPVSDKILHIDFYQVNLKEKVKVEVPIEISGESPAVEKSEGLLLTPLSEVEIEALPTDLPDSIKVDISKLEHLDDTILISDLKLPAGVTILNSPEETIVKIGELVTKEMEEVEAEIEAERVEAEEEVKEAEETAEAKVEEEKAEEETAEVPEGEAPKEESSKEET